MRSSAYLLIAAHLLMMPSPGCSPGDRVAADSLQIKVIDCSPPVIIAVTSGDQIRLPRDVPSGIAEAIYKHVLSVKKPPDNTPDTVSDFQVRAGRPSHLPNEFSIYQFIIVRRGDEDPTYVFARGVPGRLIDADFEKAAWDFLNGQLGAFLDSLAADDRKKSLEALDKMEFGMNAHCWVVGFKLEGSEFGESGHGSKHHETAFCATR